MKSVPALIGALEKIGATSHKHWGWKEVVCVCGVDLCVRACVSHRQNNIFNCSLVCSPQ